MWNKFKHRSSQKELLDEANIPQSLLFKNLSELDKLNRRTGGHSISLKGLKQLVTNHTKTYNIVDLGCGSGDALKVFAEWARINNYNVKLTGLDMNSDAIDYLKNHCKDYPEINGITADYKEYLNKTENIDIIHGSLFCHHLNEEELLNLFSYFSHKVKTGFIINDLSRHWVAYYGVWLLTRVLNGSKLAKNDGPISILRAFKYVELKDLFKKAAIKDFSIKKKWLFRFLIVGKTGNYE